MYEYAVEWIGGKSAGISSWILSTTPRRKVRESSLRSAGAEREVDDAGERGRRDARERDESEDAPARRALNDTPDPFRDRDPECAPAPAYRCHSAERDDVEEDREPDEAVRGVEANTVLNLFDRERCRSHPEMNTSHVATNCVEALSVIA